jgi:chromosome segregation ATPase
MPTNDLGFLDEVESTIQQLLNQLPDLEEALASPPPVVSNETIMETVGASLEAWNQKLADIARTLGTVTEELEQHQSEVRSWSETFAQSRQRAEKLRG